MNAARGLFSALAAGTLFGAGLTVSGMTDPQRVRGFLNLFSRWDPTLSFVMGGAVAVMAIAWQVRKHMGHPLYAEKFMFPDRTDLDTRLIAGSALFGVGWGMAGLCPGPAIASLTLAPAAVLPFVAAMLAGMGIHHLLVRLSPRRR